MLTIRVISFSSLLFFLFFSVSLSESDRDISATKLLLSFKANSDPSGSLSSWVNSSDHCSGSWLGVSCDSATGRVTRLILENLGLTGSVNPLTGLAELRHLSLNNNSLWSRDSSLDLSSWPNLKHLYLSNNRFVGRFPRGVSSLRRLQRLDLSHNGFSGVIAMAELAALPRLLTLRLESNRFEGGLEDSKFADSQISDFNVSGNSLSGEIPRWLSKFSATSFGGNGRLCGRPLSSYNCSSDSSLNSQSEVELSEKKRNDTGLSRSVFLAIVVLVAVLSTVLAAMATVVVICWLRRNQRPWKSSDMGLIEKRGGNDSMVVFEGCRKGVEGSVEELLRASAEMLGKGSVGTTYKVELDSGDCVVVKRAKAGKLGKEVDWWLSQVLGKLRHHNIASLRAYHRTQNQDLLLLVYDYFPTGSLHHLLHGYRGPGRTPVNWATRLKLASDSARGLCFLHHHSNKIKLFHGKFSSANILVDHLGNACVADVGLHQLLCGKHLPLISDYTSPELTTLGSNSNNGSTSTSTSTGPRKYTQKCDVYSFGVVLLEILTGKMAAMEGEMSLVDWIRSVARKEWTSSWDVLDVELLRNKETEDEIKALFQVAMLCLAPSPKDRPAMSVVYRMIEDIRTKGTRSLVDDFTLSAASSPE